METLLVLIGIYIIYHLLQGTWKKPPDISQYQYTEEPVEPYKPRKVKFAWDNATLSQSYIEYDGYINSPLWKDSIARLAALQADKYSCRMCNSSDRLEVHHISYDNLAHELPEDLATLCHDCHKYTHKMAGKGAKTYPPLKAIKD